MKNYTEQIKTRKMKEDAPDKQALCQFCDIFIFLKVMTPYCFKKCKDLQMMAKAAET